MKDEQVTQTQEGVTAEAHAGLRDAASFPLFDALSMRRTRRISRGVSVLAGDISHTSENEPRPLSPLEEAILIVTVTGVTGVVMHDGPTEKPGGNVEQGTFFLHSISGTASSADNARATSFFLINDEGTWLLRRLEGREAFDLLKEVPRKWSEWTEDTWLSVADRVKQKVYDQRIDYPRHWPYYLAWNKQISNLPGSSIFFPVVDCTRQYINGLMTLLSEPSELRSLFIDDYQKFRPRTLQDWGGWLAMRLHLIEKIPYQPIGGVKRAKSGTVNADNIVPLGYARTLRTDYEAFFLMQNLMLVGESLGLGSWIHGSILPPYVMQRDESKGFLGLGFREHGPKLKRFRRWPPLPASQPNFVGIDGVLEGLCPPYVGSMDEAVESVLEQKFGDGGVYSDKDMIGFPYRTSAAAEAFLDKADPPQAENVAYAKEVCNYIYDTYGRFPAHVNSFYCPGMWVQFSHLELEYYDKVADPSYYERQARHEALWERNGSSA
jgi:hypothetical protein